MTDFNSHFYLSPVVVVVVVLLFFVASSCFFVQSYKSCKHNNLLQNVNYPNNSIE